MLEKIEIQRLRCHHVRQLRQDILRPGQPVSAVTYPGDEAIETLHLGAFWEGDLIGVASVFQESHPERYNSRAWRLRGMGVLEPFQGHGVGRALLRRCIAYVATQGGTSLWCNARTPVLGFYLSMDFKPSGDEFNIPGAGPHYFIERFISPEDYAKLIL